MGVVSAPARNERAKPQLITASDSAPESHKRKKKMELKYLGGGDPKGAARESIDVPIGRYAGLALVISGTTDTGETLDESDVGRIRIQRGGRQLQGETFEFYYDYTNLKGGWPHKTAPTAGASRITAVIPFEFPGIPNSMDVRSKEELDVYLDFDSVLDTRFGANAATYELYGIVADATPETYELMVEEQDIQRSAAGRADEVLDGQNIGAIYLRDASNIIDKVQIEVDGRTVVDNIDDAMLLDVTTLINRVETSGIALTEINFVAAGRIEELINRNVEAEFNFTGAGTLQLTKFRAVSSRRASESIDAVQAVLQAKRGSGVAAARAVPRGAV